MTPRRAALWAAIFVLALFGSATLLAAGQEWLWLAPIVAAVGLVRAGTPGSTVLGILLDLLPVAIAGALMLLLATRLGDLFGAGLLASLLLSFLASWRSLWSGSGQEALLRGNREERVSEHVFL